MSIQHFAAAPGQIISFLLSSCVKSLVERSTLLIQRGAALRSSHQRREGGGGSSTAIHTTQLIHNSPLMFQKDYSSQCVLIYDWCDSFSSVGVLSTTQSVFVQIEVALSRTGRCDKIPALSDCLFPEWQTKNWFECSTSSTEISQQCYCSLYTALHRSPGVFLFWIWCFKMSFMCTCWKLAEGYCYKYSTQILKYYKYT